MNPPLTWILVADGGVARLFSHRFGHDFAPVDGDPYERNPNPATRDQGTDRPGRTHDSAGPGHRHAMEPPVDFHQQREDRFADHWAQTLHDAALAGRFDEIVIVAPAKFMGRLRQKLSKQVESKVKAEVTKDYIHHSIQDLQKALIEHLPNAGEHPLRQSGADVRLRQS